MISPGGFARTVLAGVVTGAGVLLIATGELSITGLTADTERQTRMTQLQGSGLDEPSRARALAAARPVSCGDDLDPRAIRACAMATASALRFLSGTPRPARSCSPRRSATRRRDLER